ncbi:MAG TPA: UDP-N-acetylglucosamine 2-epimerase (non-hydrolyzing), partial [Acinetobacter radioresistens]|nr:UDP-N-acetylglucosamine 2-epimerase (non-hydrolyzing) [Acinetobacter radioresistens]
LQEKNKLVLITAHRRENFGQGIQNICQAIHELCQRYPELHFAWPVHLNPHVHTVAHQEFAQHPQVHLLSPLDYPDLLAILQASYLIMTDSGGIQEESPTYQKPVLILRDVTERPEVVEAGCGVLVGTDVTKIVQEFSRLMDDHSYYLQHAEVENPFGDGRASGRILEQIIKDLNPASS